MTKFPFGELDKLPNDYVVAELNLEGFPGGHSGVMIHNARGNAIQSLADLLTSFSAEVDLRLLNISGGSARNAIPSAAKALIALSVQDAEKVEPIVDRFLQKLREGQELEDPSVTGVLSPERAKNVKVVITPVDSESIEADKVLVFSGEFQRRILNVIRDLPTGPFSSAELPNVGKLVTLSNNLGIVRTSRSGVEVINMTRGANIEALRAKIAAIRAFLLDNGGVVEQEEPSSGWLEDPATSQAVQMVQSIVREVMGESRFLAYHAGLEAGIISGKRPKLSAVAVGPLILEAHTPRERVSLDSIAAQVKVLRQVLASVN